MQLIKSSTIACCAILMASSVTGLAATSPSSDVSLVRLAVRGAPAATRCVQSDTESDNIFMGSCTSIDAAFPYTVFELITLPNGNVMFKNAVWAYFAVDQCLDADGTDSDRNTNMPGHAQFSTNCKKNEPSKQWKYSAKTGKIASADPKYKNKCLTRVESTDKSDPEAPSLVLESCTNARLAKNQRWVMESNDIKVTTYGDMPMESPDLDITKAVREGKTAQ